MAGHGNRLRRLRWVLLGLGLVALVTVVTLWLMFQHIPSWYRPPGVAPANHQRIRNDWAGSRDSLEQKLLRQEPFEFAFTQDQLNAWLAIREAVWPLSREWLPNALSDPFILIEKDSIRVAVTYRSGAVRTIISARLQFAVQPGGIKVTLSDLAGGSLAIPDSWVRDRLALVDGRSWPTGQRSRYQLGGPPLAALPDVLSGMVFADMWTWEGAKLGGEGKLELPFQITSIRAEPGILIIGFRPLPR